MKALKIVLIVIGVLVVLIVALFAVFWLIYKQGVVEPYALGNPNADTKVLIASQGSDFKNTLVDSLTSRLADESMYMKVIDVTGLGEVNENDWDAVVLIHTTENWRLQSDVKAYLDRVHGLSKIIVVTTSGSGEWKSEDYDVDVVTSASKTEELPGMVKHIVARLEQIMHVVSVE